MSETLGTTIVQVAALGKQVTTGGAQLTILRDISFTVSAGEAVAIVGVSGSGKSTLLGLMAGLDTPTAGSVAINGHDLFALDEDGRAALRGRMMGFVFQSFQLLPEFTALENVMLPLKYAGIHLRKRRAMAKQALEQVGLGDRLHHNPGELSGGQQQRVAIARSVVNSPAIIFGDELTGELDSQMTAEVMKLVIKLNKAGQTFVIVTHNPEVAKVCRRIIYMRDGKIEKEFNKVTVR